MRFVGPLLFLCSLLPWAGTSLSSNAAGAQLLACQLQCKDFECDVPPSIDLSQLLMINGSNRFSCPLSARGDSVCRVVRSEAGAKLLFDFNGMRLRIFYNLTITSGSRVVFRNKPCLYERPLIRVNIVGTKVSVVSHGCHFEGQLQSRVICRAEGAASVSQTFQFKESFPNNRLTGLRPFTKYNCSIHNRYEHLHHSNCISRWFQEDSTSFRTDPSLPSAAPTPLGFQRHGADCYVYFKAVPPALLNGEIQNYRWKCGEQNRNSSLFSFSVDCASRRCSLWARNQKGDGPSSRPLMLRDDVQRPRLQLWSEGSGVRPVVEGASREGSSLIICGCGACEGEQPSCVSMTTRPLGSGAFRVDLRSQRVAVMRNDSSGPVMSEWVSCSYDPEAAIRTFPLEEIADVSLLPSPEGDRVQVRIPSAELRCPRATKPIDVVTVRQSCGSPGGPDVFFRRRAGQSSLKFDISWRPGCQLLLSVDNESFAKVYPRQHSSELPPGAIAGLILGILCLFGLSFLIVRYRQAFTNGYRTVCQEHSNFEENGASNKFADRYYFEDEHDGYASVYDDSPHYPPAEDEGTRPMRGEYDGTENYTPQC